MASINFEAFTARSRRLLVALAENAAELPDVKDQIAVLQESLGVAEEAKTRQDAHIGNKQVATQDLKAALARGKDAFVQLQNAVKSKLGLRNEKLAAFQVKPLRKHAPRQSAKLKKQEEVLKQQEADLQKQENDFLKREVELLKKEAEPAPAS